ncbi:MAG: acylphosphatase [Gammaproteobacteria bacterium]|jgi:acylphosphatase
MNISINFFISGRVQGVCFRMATCQQAKLLGLTGWVRNLDDGRVEVLACGEAPLLEELRKWLSHGPSMAKVLNLEYVTVEYQEYPDFSIR